MKGLKANVRDMKMKSLGDVANCASWAYSPVCVRHEGSTRWADIEDHRYINRRNIRPDSRRQDLGNEL